MRFSSLILKLVVKVDYNVVKVSSAKIVKIVK
jgi:hypothetical protein